MKTKFRLVRLVAVVAVMLGLGIFPAGVPSAQTLDQDIVAKTWPAVVQLGPLIEVTQGQSTKQVPLGWGSGTIVSPDGYILTNHHVTDLTQLIDAYQDRTDARVIEDKLVVFITKSEDSPPVPTFIAEVAVDSPKADLAVLRIIEDLSGEAVDATNLNLPYLYLGDSDQLKLAQRLYIFGYPGIGGDTITVTSGDVSGFTYEAGTEGRAWIKTSASISGGNSGGSAVDDKGMLVGIPTQTGSGQIGSPSIDCRPYTDTNGDGVLDDKDLCVPVGGFINALRPANLAKPLIEEALGGVIPQPRPTEQPTQVPTSTPAPEETVTAVPSGTTVSLTPGTPPPTRTRVPSPTPSIGAEVSRLIFANGVNDYEQPVSVVEVLPSGSRDLILFFDYSGFENGATWQPHAYVNGKELVDAWLPDSWDAESFGTSGMFWVGFMDADLTDGTYKFEIAYEDITIGSASIEVGGDDPRNPTFSNIALSAGGETGYTLPGGVTQVSADFDADNMTEGLNWTQTWYEESNGSWHQIGRSSTSWNGSGSGNGTARLTSNTELEAGLYRLELTIEETLVATSDFALAGQTAKPSFGSITFAGGIDSEGDPVRPGKSFSSGLDELFAFWDYQSMEDGLTWNVTWLLNGTEVVNEDYVWDDGASGTEHVSVYGSDGPLPAGSYELQLSVEDKMIQSDTAVIQGQPSPTPRPRDGVYIKGNISDAVTGQPIEGAIFVVLSEGITWSTYHGYDSEVQEIATTDRRGEFALNYPLRRGATYSMGVGAEGYQPIKEDNNKVTSDLPGVLELDITLQPGW